jgi:hypothetical protein
MQVLKICRPTIRYLKVRKSGGPLRNTAQSFLKVFGKTSCVQGFGNSSVCFKKLLFKSGI